ncbi:MAG: GNAT family N-acetyltransferase [Fimbriimonadales bacterium]|nr:GNAT family N-acetyltransferase [Fimbriimonadales bacterium]
MTPVFRELRPDEQAACLDLWAQVFTPSRDYFERYFQDALWQPRYTRVCEVDGRLAAAVQLVRRPVRLANGHTLWMAGVANVATLPDYRGRGYASQLLQDLQRVMDAEDFAFGLLFTGIHDFYGRLGWERLPLPLYEATPTPVDIAGWRFRVAEPDELTHLQRWYAAFYADHPLSVARDDAYWRIWTRWDDPKWRSKFYLAEDSGGAPRGYLALETYHEADEQGNRIVSGIGLAELGCDPTDDEAVRALIGFASQTAHLAGVSLSIFLPEADMQRFIRPLLPDVRWIGQGSAMVRVCNWERVYEALGGGLGEMPRSVAEASHSSATCTGETPVPQAVALALLLGLPAPDGAPVSPELRARYPLRPACYSPVDSF